GLDVAVDDRRDARVQVRQHAIGVREKARDVCVRERGLAAAKRGQSFALDFLHYQVQRAVFLEVLDVHGQVRVRQRRQHARLALGELHVLPAFCAAYLEALDGHRTAVQLVDGVERLGLRARAELPDDRVPTRAQRAGDRSR